MAVQKAFNGHALISTNKRCLGKTQLHAENIDFLLNVVLPDNGFMPIYLCFLAWLKGQLGRDGALADAERANALAPNQPAFMDTWAMLLSAANQHERALEMQKKVVQLQPQVLEFKLNLAKIQIKAGNKDAARALLDELSAAGDRFSAQAEVDRLKKTL